MIDTRTAPYAALVLRVTLGVLFLLHAGVKIFVFTPAGTVQFFGSLGLPAAFAYLVMTAEVLGGVALILGIWTRVVAVLLTPILIGAIVLVHGANGFDSGKGGWEFVGFWAVMQIVLALVGDGAYALVPTPAGSAATRLQPVR